MPSIEDSLCGELPVQLGEVVAGKYQVIRLLGRGGMGVVLQAQHQLLDQKVAIKFLRPELACHPTVASRFLQEARAVSKIRGENVVRVMDCDRLESGLPYIVMEYLEGCTVADHLAAKGPLSVREAVDILLQAGVGVAEAHASGIIHRDLKPANLWLALGTDRQTQVKVLDFGISKILNPDLNGSLTHADQLLGSPHYMSPEQMRSPDRVDERSDIWSLGIVLFELLSGQVPFPGRSLLAIFSESLNPPCLSQLCPNVPPEVDSVVRRCLARQREERPASIAELAELLRPFGSPRAEGWAKRVQRLAGHPNYVAQVASDSDRPVELSEEPGTRIAGSRWTTWPRTVAPKGRWGAVVALLCVGALVGYLGSGYRADSPPQDDQSLGTRRPLAAQSAPLPTPIERRIPEGVPSADQPLSQPSSAPLAGKAPALRKKKPPPSSREVPRPGSTPAAGFKENPVAPTPLPPTPHPVSDPLDLDRRH